MLPFPTGAGPAATTRGDTITDSSPLTGAARIFAETSTGLPACCFLVDHDGVYRWVNREFLELVEAEEAELLGRRLTEVPGPAVDLAGRIADVLDGNQAARFDRIRLRRPGLPTRWAMGMAFPIRSDTAAMVGGCLFALGEHADLITELGLLLAQAPMFILCTDAELRYTWSAGASREAFGLATPGAGRTAYEILGTTDPEHPWIVPLRAALDGAEGFYQFRLREHTFDNRVGPLRDSAGRIVGTVAVVVDSTEHEATRRREQLAEERFRTLVDLSPALVAIRDAEDRIVHLNPAFLRTFDLSLDDLIGQTGSDLAVSPAAIGLIATGRQVRETGLTRIWEGRLLHPTGRRVDLLGHVFPLPLADGSTGVGEVFLDMTTHERARRELVESDRRFRAIFDHAEISILLLDLDARILDANAAAVRLSGRSLSELRGRFIGKMTTRSDVTAYGHLWLDLVAGRRSRFDVNVTLRHADGTRTPVRLTVTLIRDRDGKPAQGLWLAMPAGRPDDAFPAPAERALTSAEADVLARLAAGRELLQIAAELGLTRRGVDYRVSQLRRKLRAPGPDGVPATSAALVARAYALGIIHPATWPPQVELDGPGDPTS